MKKIPIGKGKFALVDDKDFDLLSRERWYLVRGYASCYRRSLGRTTFMHRMILKTPKGMCTDHIDGNGLNNQRSNLRICNYSQNLANRRKIKKCSSKYKGVNLRSDRTHEKMKWRVHVQKKYVGSFATEKEAALAYNEEAKKVFGDFAFLNPV